MQAFTVEQVRRLEAAAMQHVPEGERPEQEPLEVDYDPWKSISWNPDAQRWQADRAAE